MKQHGARRGCRATHPDVHDGGAAGEMIIDTEPVMPNMSKRLTEKRKPTGKVLSSKTRASGPELNSRDRSVKLTSKMVLVKKLGMRLSVNCGSGVSIARHMRHV